MKIISNDNSYIIGITEECVSEFKVRMPTLLPCEKCTVKVIKRHKKDYLGYTDIMIKMNYCNYVKQIIGIGKSAEEALYQTIQSLIETIKIQYPDGLTIDDVEYIEEIDF